MTYEEIVNMIDETGLPNAYDHFAEGDSPAPPYIAFMLPGRDDFLADNKPYVKVTMLTLELYMEYKDPECEEQIEAVLESHEIIYDKSETWISSEKLYEVIYEMEVIYNADTCNE